MSTNTNTSTTAAQAQPQKKPRQMFTLARDLVSNIKAPQWLVDGLLEKDALSCLFGASGEGKSFFAIDMSCSIATGTDWHGCKVDQGPVIYLAGEGQGGISRRLAAWSLDRGVALDEAFIAISKHAVALLDKDAANAAIAEVERLIAEELPAGVKPSLVVIDTLARSMSGGDENSAKDMSEFVARLDTMRERWGCNVMTVHHTGHDSSRARGSSALRAAMDQEMFVEKVSGGMRKLSVTKMKDAETPGDRTFKLDTVNIAEATDNLGRRVIINSAVTKLLTAVETPVDTARFTGKEALTPAALVDLLVDGWPGMDSIAAQFRVSKRVALEAISQAVDLDLIEKSGRGYKLTFQGRTQNRHGPGGLGLQ